MRATWGSLCLYVVILSGASGGPYPIVTNITIEPDSPTSWTYHFEQQVVESAAVDSPIPFNQMALGHKHSDSENSEFYRLSYSGKPYSVVPGDTWSMAAMKVYNDGGKSVTSMIHSGGSGGSECVGYLGFDRNTEQWSDAYAGPLGCTHAPPVNNSCSFDSPQITIDHGSRNISAISGSVKTNTLRVTCVLPTTISIKLFPENLDLGGISSHLTAPASVNVASGGTDIAIQSELSLSGTPEYGVHQAAGIVKLDYE